MKANLLKLLIVITAMQFASLRATESANSLIGKWIGTLNVGVATLRLGLMVEAVNGALSGTMTSLDQGGAKMALTAVTEKGKAVHFDIASIGARFEGELTKDASEIIGQWTQGPNKLPLTFKRSADEPKLQRPQEPTKPYPYHEEDIFIRTKSRDVTLAGTLTLPKGNGPHPAVILITGSGPQDRDEALMGHRPFLVLADHLTRQGIAVLRCDDRGIGKSTGDFGKATGSDFVEDTLAAVAWLKTRKEVNARLIGLIGHSEGGIIAPVAAVKNTNDIAFIVMLAGVGVPMDELLIRQGTDIARAAGASADTLAKNAVSQRELLSQLKQAKDSVAAESVAREQVRKQMESLTPEQRQVLGMSEGAIDAQVKMAASPWFRQLLGYDPRPTLRQVKCPVLAINGEKDVQVAAKENIESIKGALAEGGNKHVTTAILPGLNHLFQTCRTGAVSEYGEIEETMAPNALQTVSGWIAEQMSGK